MNPQQAAAELGLPTDKSTLLRLVARCPNIARAMGDVNNGATPEGAAARYDLAWIDDGPAGGVDWQPTFAEAL